MTGSARSRNVFRSWSPTARRSPGCKLAAPGDFGDAGFDPVAAGGRQQLDRRADAQTVELVPAS
jgi:hypothetical protein